MTNINQNSFKGKIIIIFFIFLMFTTCKTVNEDIDNKYKDLMIDITQHPEKILDLNKYYPEFYNKNCMSRLMNDSEYIEEIINYINLDYNYDKSNFYIRKFINSKFSIKEAISRGRCDCSVDTLNYLSAIIKKGHYAISFDFVKCDSSYKIYHITTMQAEK